MLITTDFEVTFSHASVGRSMSNADLPCSVLFCSILLRDRSNHTEDITNNNNNNNIETNRSSDRVTSMR